MFKSKYQQGQRFKIRIPGRVRKIFISVIVLLILLLATGAIYTYQTGKNSQPLPAVPSTKASEAPHVYKPPKPADNAREGVALVSILSPVKAGDNTTISISTNAGSTCTILVTYNNVVSKDSGLTTKTADDYGSASWTWTVNNSIPIGTWPVKVTCTYNKQSGVLIADLKVTK